MNKLILYLQKFFWRLKITIKLAKWSASIILIKYHPTFADFGFLLLYGFSSRFKDITNTVLTYEVSFLALALFFFYMIVAKYVIHPIFGPNFFYHFYFFNYIFGIYVFYLYFNLY